MFKIGVLASGKGSNLKSIIDFIKDEKPPFEIASVISDNPSAYALQIARQEGINSYYIPAGAARTYLEPDVEEQYVNTLIKSDVDLVCLAGFMRMLKGVFLEGFRDRIVNIHPSLLPAFPGIESWKQALEYGVRFSGCTTHFVNDGMDTGPVIMQAVVPVLADDTCDSLHRRIQQKEHIIYPLTIKLISEGRVTLSDKRVYIN